jgi:hypothetical protein
MDTMEKVQKMNRSMTPHAFVLGVVDNIMFLLQHWRTEGGDYGSFAANHIECLE